MRELKSSEWKPGLPDAMTLTEWGDTAHVIIEGAALGYDEVYTASRTIPLLALRMIGDDAEVESISRELDRPSNQVTWAHLVCGAKESCNERR